MEAIDAVDAENQSVHGNVGAFGIPSASSSGCAGEGSAGAVAVIGVGLGGRSTPRTCSISRVAVITPISLEHRPSWEHAGRIARQAGIIKAGQHLCARAGATAVVT
jgi:folylpolyglutamate synthase/dihydropteroate synthase